jgi:hypothetical protein
MTATARAGEVEDVNSKLWSIWSGDQLTPIVLNDSNWSLSEIKKDLNGDGVDETIITGFIDFGDNWGRGSGNIGTTPIKDIASGSPSVDPDDPPALELTGWFAGVVIGGSPTGFGGISPDDPFNSNPFVYLGALPDPTSFDVDFDGDGTADATWTWNPDGTGTMVQFFADSNNDVETDTNSIATTYAKSTNGTKVMEVGMRGTPADGTEAAGTAYGAGLEYYALGFKNTVTGQASGFFASLNTTWALGSVFSKLAPNDTGNNFYASGTLFLAGDASQFEYSGGGEGKILLLPLPSGALAGLALLGLLGFGRQIRRKKSM